MTSADKAATVLDPTAATREHMVERQKERGAIWSDERIAAAFRAVPRHVFLPGVDLDKVYSGDVIPTRFDEQKRPISSSSEVGVMWAMAQQLELERGHRVLEVGAGTGYNAGILAHLVGDGGSVTTVDIDPAIAREAREHLDAAGYQRVRVEVGDGWVGVESNAPYDRIELTASVDDLSPRWAEQLVEGGILVAPLFLRATQLVVGLRKRGARFESSSVVDGGFMALRGDHGWASAGTEVDKWLVTRGDGAPVDVDALKTLLGMTPHVELAADVPRRLAWMITNLVALLEPDIMTFVLKEGPGIWAIGIHDPRGPGLGVAHVGGGPFTGPLVQFVGFGDAAALDRLRARMRELAEVRREDLRIEAVPTSAGGRPSGKVVVPRRNYTFGIGLGSR
jgi:protein-L-isoaspartate(D-aspartate) O-methyltransferase